MSCIVLLLYCSAPYSVVCVLYQYYAHALYFIIFYQLRCTVLHLFFSDRNIFYYIALCLFFTVLWCAGYYSFYHVSLKPILFCFYTVLYCTVLKFAIAVLQRITLYCFFQFCSISYFSVTVHGCNIYNCGFLIFNLFQIYEKIY